MSTAPANGKRKAVLTEDATLFEGSVQLNYRRRGHPALFTGPPKELCPPLENLKKGTKVIITFHDRAVTKVELA